ncbi:MAG TPA: RDD family protein, partial [Cellvibrionaceae bacterium]|nr:RDD family protein [Cellvibrionaceae bacterium]
AYGIDLFIRLIALAAVSSVLGVLGKLGGGLMLLIMFSLEWFYPVVFDVFNQGATPGKRIMQLQVVHDDGSPVSFSSSLLRNLLMVVDFLPVFYCLGTLVSICHPFSKRLGDIAAGTLVIHQSTASRHIHLDAGLGKRAPFAGLSLPERRALVSFAERCPSLSQARQAELAGILAPLLPADCAEQAVLALQQMANQIAGASIPADKEPQP